MILVQTITNDKMPDILLPRILLCSIHSGNFTCTAWNTLSSSAGAGQSSPGGHTVIRTGYAQIAVDVRRKPGPAVIVAKRLAVAVGEQIVLGCGTDGDAGNPPARFKWASPATSGKYGRSEPEFNLPQLRMPIAQLSDNGIYRCFAHNEIGQGEEAQVRVTVRRPIKIISAFFMACKCFLSVRWLNRLG